ncbi:MAG: hypothetical protein Q4B17_14620 [Lautropia sp.]|nr:hypothetical protein [Lautropia sp.]
MRNNTDGLPVRDMPMLPWNWRQSTPADGAGANETMTDEDALVFSALLRTQVCAAPGRPLHEKPAIEAALLVRIQGLDEAAVSRAMERLVRTRWVRRTWALDAGGQERVFLAANAALVTGGEA